MSEEQLPAADSMGRSAEDFWAAASAASLLLLSVLFVYAVFFTAPAPGSHGMPHGEFATMLGGGDGAERHGSMLLIGWAVGMAQILFFGALMGLGARRGPYRSEPPGSEAPATGHRSRTGLRGLGPPMALGLAATGLVWTLLMVSYGRYLKDPEPALYFSLPAPTAWMLYGLWATPLIFSVLYVVGFRRWVFSHEDEAAFQALIESTQVESRQSSSRESGAH